VGSPSAAADAAVDDAEPTSTKGAATPAASAGAGSSSSRRGSAGGGSAKGKPKSRSRSNKKKAPAKPKNLVTKVSEAEFTRAMFEYQQMTRVQLRAQCKENGATMSGNKGVLLGRLRDVVDPERKYFHVQLPGVVDPKTVKPRARKPRVRLKSSMVVKLDALKPKPGPGSTPCSLEERGAREYAVAFPDEAPPADGASATLRAGSARVVV